MEEQENKGDFANWDEVDPKILGRLKKIKEHGTFLKNEAGKVKNNPQVLFKERTKISKVENKLNENLENILQKEKDRLMKYMDEQTSKDSKKSETKLKSTKRSLSVDGNNVSTMTGMIGNQTNSDKLYGIKIFDEISLNTGLSPINLKTSTNFSTRDADVTEIPEGKQKQVGFSFNLDLKKGLNSKQRTFEKNFSSERESWITKEAVEKLQRNSFELGDTLGGASHETDFSSSTRTVANNKINRKIKFLDQSEQTLTQPELSWSKGNMEFYEKEINYFKEELHKKNREIVALKNIIYRDTSLMSDKQRDEILISQSGKIKKFSIKKILNDFRRSHLKIRFKLRNKTKRVKKLTQDLKDKGKEHFKINTELDNILDSFLINESIIQEMQKNNEFILKEIQNLTQDKKLIMEGFDSFKKNIEAYLITYAEKLKKYNERESKCMALSEENEKLKGEKEYLLAMIYKK